MVGAVDSELTAVQGGKERPLPRGNRVDAVAPLWVAAVIGDCGEVLNQVAAQGPH